MRKTIRMIILIPLSLVILFLLISTITGFLLSGPKYKGPTSDHFNGAKFINPQGIKAKGFPDLIRWMTARKQGKWETLTNTVPGVRPAESIADAIRITFVNHSAFLIQAYGLNILTDPVWSERASPFSWAGPKRMRPPGIRFEDLPRIDLILISHNHYDHLDLSTLRRLCAQYKPLIITPLGVKKLLEKEKIPVAYDLDWWDEVDISERLVIQTVPAQHFSGRGTFDRDATLWCGFVIRHHQGNIYFAGDTGYNEQTFQEIGRRCNPVKISLLPIGAYKPRWFMSPIHTSPEDAVKIHLDVRSQVSIGTHFGTFPLADDGHLEPLEDLNKALNKYGISTNHFRILQEGSFYETHLL